MKDYYWGKWWVAIIQYSIVMIDRVSVRLTRRSNTDGLVTRVRVNWRIIIKQFTVLPFDNSWKICLFRRYCWHNLFLKKNGNGLYWGMTVYSICSCTVHSICSKPSPESGKRFCVVLYSIVVPYCAGHRNSFLSTKYLMFHSTVQYCTVLYPTFMVHSILSMRSIRQHYKSILHFYFNGHTEREDWRTTRWIIKENRSQSNMSMGSALKRTVSHLR